MKYAHVEAFCLMTYANRDAPQDTVVIWNSRDGVTPFCYFRKDKAEMVHDMRNHRDRFAPNHVPEVGDLIWASATKADAAEWAKRSREQYELMGVLPTFARGFDDFEAQMFEGYLEDVKRGAPILREVTQAMRDEFAQQAHERTAAGWAKAQSLVSEKAIEEVAKGWAKAQNLAIEKAMEEAAKPKPTAPSSDFFWWEVGGGSEEYVWGGPFPTVEAALADALEGEFGYVWVGHREPINDFVEREVKRMDRASQMVLDCLGDIADAAEELSGEGAGDGYQYDDTPQDSKWLEGVIERVNAIVAKAIVERYGVPQQLNAHSRYSHNLDGWVKDWDKQG